VQRQGSVANLTKNVTDGREVPCQNLSAKAFFTRDWPVVHGLMFTYVTPYSSRAPIMPNASRLSGRGIYSASKSPASWSFLTMVNGADPA